MAWADELRSRPSWRTITAATAWNHPAVNAFDQLVSFVLRCRDCLGWAEVEAVMSDEVANVVAIDAPDGSFHHNADYTDVMIGPPPLWRVCRIVIGDTGKPSRVILRPIVGGDDVWIDTGVDS